VKFLLDEYDKKIRLRADDPRSASDFASRATLIYFDMRISRFRRVDTSLGWSAPPRGLCYEANGKVVVKNIKRGRML
jgi:hypothetical protein